MNKKNLIKILVFVTLIFPTIIYASETSGVFTVTKVSGGMQVNADITNHSSTEEEKAVFYLFHGPSLSQATIPATENPIFNGVIKPNTTVRIVNKKISATLPSGKYYAKIGTSSNPENARSSLEVVSTNGDSDGKDGGNGKSSGADSNGDSDGKDGGNGKSSGVQQSTTLENPLKVDSLWGFVELVLGWVVRIGSVVVGLFLLIAGFNFVTAQGNEEKLAAAKRGLLYTIIGAILLLGAWTIATVISNTIEQIAK